MNSYVRTSWYEVWVDMEQMLWKQVRPGDMIITEAINLGVRYIARFSLVLSIHTSLTVANYRYFKVVLFHCPPFEHLRGPLQGRLQAIESTSLREDMRFKILVGMTK